MDFLNNLEKKMNEKNLNKSQLARGMGVAPVSSALPIGAKGIVYHSNNA